ncbi:MAG: YezD family protein [Opitutaceae bacterium]
MSTSTQHSFLHSDRPDWIALVREKVESLSYGVVQLIVHDGRVTQIERTEKIRLPAARDVQGND